MVFNNDWLLNQIRGTANMIGKVFKLENLQIDLGVIEDEEGRTISGNDYLNQLTSDENFDQATRFIHSQLKKLSPFEYRELVDVYILYLRALDRETKKRCQINDNYIDGIQSQLQQFSW